MTKWEYKTLVIDEDDDDSYIDEAMLNKLGAQGWELVFFHMGWSSAVFKRPKQ